MVRSIYALIFPIIFAKQELELLSRASRETTYYFS